MGVPALPAPRVAAKDADSTERGAEVDGRSVSIRIYTTSFASVYPHYVAKAEKKGRTKAEVDEIIRWLTGYTPGGAGRAARREDRLRDLLRAGARAEPVARADHGRGLRRAGRGGRGAADAGDPLPGQADRRAGQGQGDGEDPPRLSPVPSPRQGDSIRAVNAWSEGVTVAAVSRPAMRNAGYQLLAAPAQLLGGNDVPPLRFAQGDKSLAPLQRASLPSSGSCPERSEGSAAGPPHTRASHLETEPSDVEGANPTAATFRPLGPPHCARGPSG